jgi:hypothetical protein
MSASKASDYGVLGGCHDRENDGWYIAVVEEFDLCSLASARNRAGAQNDGRPGRLFTNPNDGGDAKSVA